MSKWIPVSERLPKHGMLVLAVWPESGDEPLYLIAKWDQYDNEWQEDGDFPLFNAPSHWCPLPPPPQKE